MNSPNLQPPIDDETLVAFLDGELPSEKLAQIEGSIQFDPSLRKRVDALQSSWDLLGDLPGYEPRRDLAQSTIEIVTLAIEQESQTWWSWLLRNRWLAVGLAGLIMFTAGAATARGLTNFMTRQLLANLPSIVHYPSLKNIDSVDLLERLRAIPNLTVAASSSTGPIVIGDGIVPRSIEERKLWVEQLNEDSRGRLENNSVEYVPLKENRKAAMRAVADKIYEDPARTNEYLQTIRAYYSILDTISKKRQIAYLEGKMSIDERIAEISGRVATLMALNYTPSMSDRYAFREWLDEIAYATEENSLNFMFLDSDTHIINELLSSDPENSFVTADDVATLVQKLSHEAVARLNDLADESAKRRQLGYWISSVVQSVKTSEQGQLEPIDFERSFQSLPESRRDELDFMPEEEVHKYLRKLSEHPSTPSTTGLQK